MRGHVVLRLLLIGTVAVSGLIVLIAPTAAQGEPVRIIFMHHSTGEGLIWEGNVREAFTSLGYEFWDHGYNDDGLVDAAGTYLGTHWDVPDDNTDPDGWYVVFNQPYTDPPANTFSHMLAYDVIIFKSCFPASDIQSEDDFETYRSYFLTIRDVMDQYPDKLFIPFTTPPLVPNETSPEAAARARRWSEYLTSPDYLEGHPNIAVFDFFSTLADASGYLRAEYRGDEYDSHPNQLANQTVGPLFVAFVDQAIRAFAPGEPVAAPDMAAEEPAEEAAPPADEAAVSADEEDYAPAGDIGFSAQTVGLLEDFERDSALDNWWNYADDGVAAFACILGEGFEGGQAVQVSYDMALDKYAGCGTDLLPDASWAGADGISFYYRTEPAGLYLDVGFGVADPTGAGEPTPFGIALETGSEEWTQVVIYWDDMVKADWFGDAGVDEFDPAQVVWFSLNVGYWEGVQAGSIWLDNVQLITG
ncbi:MAG: hypothetical protein JW966_11400 [Anaerolineae bacterium]|nr:hypothetical protein [Anaerolineae bacterium]